MDVNYLIRMLYSEEAIEAKIAELASIINEKYEGEEIKLICVLKGSIMITAELMKRITLPVMIDFVQCSSYGDKTVSSGNVNVKKWLDESIEGQNVIVVEDIVDTGYTLEFIKNKLLEEKPKNLEILTLLNKQSRRINSLKSDYVGF